MSKKQRLGGRAGRNFFELAVRQVLSAMIASAIVVAGFGLTAGIAAAGVLLVLRAMGVVLVEALAAFDDFDGAFD
jgi:hypothetical protein